MNYRSSKKYEEVRKFQAELLKGKNNPSKRPEVKKKISAKVSGTKNGMYGRTGKTNPFYGKTHSKEFRDYKSQLHGRKLKYKGIIYNSIRQAERLTGVSRYKIKKNCVFL